MEAKKVEDLITQQNAEARQLVEESQKLDKLCEESRSFIYLSTLNEGVH